MVFADFYRFHRFHEFGPFSTIFGPFFSPILLASGPAFSGLFGRKTAVLGLMGLLCEVWAALAAAGYADWRTLAFPRRPETGAIVRNAVDG